MSETLTGDTLPPSNVIDEPDTTAVGGGTDMNENAPTEKGEPEKPKSRREALEAAANKVDADVKTPAEKPAPEKKPEADQEEPAADGKGTPEGKEKPEPATDAKPADKPEAKTPEQIEQEKAEAKKYSTPPRRFLPKAQQTWANTPNAVKADVYRMERELEDQNRSTMEMRQEQQKLAPYADMAKKGGITLDQALERYVGMESLLRENPVKGIAELLRNVGMTPQQYAQIVSQNSPQYQAMMMQRAAQAQPKPQEAPEVTQLRDQLSQERAARVQAEVIAPFAARHPRFSELQEDIAFFLNSGRIPSNIAPNERLEAAYDMAERINPRSVSSPASPAADATGQIAQTANPRAGTASVRGAPSAGSSGNAARRGKMSRKAAIEAAMASVGS